MKCTVCNNILTEKQPFFGWGHVCEKCSIEYRIKDNNIEAWGITVDDLSLSAERVHDETIIWRMGSGYDNNLWKDTFRLPDQDLILLFKQYADNKVN